MLRQEYITFAKALRALPGGIEEGAKLANFALTCSGEQLLSDLDKEKLADEGREYLDKAKAIYKAKHKHSSKRVRNTHKGAINPDSNVHRVAASVRSVLEKNGRKLATSSLLELVVKDTNLSLGQVKACLYDAPHGPDIKRGYGTWSIAE